MALNNPKRSALFIKQQQTLPVTPDGFVEVNTELAVTPVFAESETNRLSGQMNSKETYIDTCRTSTQFLASVNMRESGAVMTAQPEYAELLKVSGFEGVIGCGHLHTYKTERTLSQEDRRGFIWTGNVST